MKVEVWSDIMCPFCYIGKRHYEAALKQLGDTTDIELEWKSFQLDPSIPKGEKLGNVYQYLAEKKGLSEDQAREMTGNVASMALQVGLELDFEHAVVANSLDAHRLIHLAQAHKLGDTVKEKLFQAHFNEGKNIADLTVLIHIAVKAGLDAAEVEAMLRSNQYTDEVEQDIREARLIGVTGVPLFVFDRKYAISGAQPVAVFRQKLEKSLAEWRAEHPVVKLDISEGPSCSADGVCG
ncbi:DsbA family oxidoreductase [Olivibacter sp. SDN3]|uniref:DsbA family oxidoreductase n=1 Tax=Olivibacter sp. SDN3 TaxID=2764720 RepID=UPI00165144CB|nr:DsbA family oxidoreductase [Olivibacter sp. SDN3]QNL51875.1 DsbA family oxidoreductase [Olivibacter sp. SDN3]